MPSSYDLPEYFNASTVEDVNKYNKLPYYLASLEAKLFPEWQVFNNLFGTIDWKPNMGTTLKGVRAEPTPIGQQQFFPVDLQSVPNKNVYETLETTEQASLKSHEFDSKQFAFLPSFQDFRQNQIDFNMKDLTRQIAISNDIFCRTVALQNARHVMVIASTDNAQLKDAPILAAGTGLTDTNKPKNDAWFQAMAAKVGTAGLTLAGIDYATMVLRDDLGAPFFENTVNTPKDNELIKGKYVLITSSEAVQMFKWDVNFAQFRDINLSIVNDGFRGSLFDAVTIKTERFPLRFKSDGTLPVPQIYDNTDNKTRPNPDYVNADFEVAFLVGADYMKTIKVGPPPRAFANRKMTQDKFFALQWNGEVRLTDQLLVTYANGTQDLNYRGKFVKLFSTLVMGAIPVNAHNAIPIIFKRKRPAVI